MSYPRWNIPSPIFPADQFSFSDSAIYSNPPRTIENGQRTDLNRLNSGYKYYSNSYYTISCNDGFQPHNGKSKSVCGNNRKWSHVLSCERTPSFSSKSFFSKSFSSKSMSKMFKNIKIPCR